MMRPLENESDVPPFEQLRLRVVEDVRSGKLAAGARLPTVRQLAEDLGLAPNTVAKSYRTLEQDGVIVTRGRNGSFVAATGDATHQAAAAAAATFAERIRKLDISTDEALDLARAALGSAP